MTIVRRLLISLPLGVVLALSPAISQAATQGHHQTKTGTLQVVVSGLPVGVRGDVIVQGPHARRLVLTKSRPLRGLAPGSYRVQIRQLTLGRPIGKLPKGSVVQPLKTTVKETVRGGHRTKLAVGYGTIRSGLIRTLPVGPTGSVTRVLGSDPSNATGIVVAGKSSYTPGMIITAAPSTTLPGGLLDTVTAVKYAYGATTLMLAPAKLSDAFPQLDIQFKVPLSASPGNVSASQVHAAAEPIISFGVGTDLGGWDAGCEYASALQQGTFAFQPRLKGTITTAGHIDTAQDFADKVVGVHVPTDGFFDVTATATGSISLAIPGAANCHLDTPKLKLSGVIDVMGLPIPVFGEVYLQLSASTTAALNEQASFTAYLVAGVVWQGGLNFSPITDGSSHLTSEATGPLQGSIDVVPTVEVAIGEDDINGHVGAGADLNFTGTVGPTTCSINLDGLIFGGIDFGPFSHDLSTTFPIAAAGGLLPPLYTCPTAPANTSAPSITGTPTPGQTLTVSNGTWLGRGTLFYTYQWEDCNSTGGSCTGIPGATSSTYTLTPGDIAHTIVAEVTANTGFGGSPPAPSAATAVIAPTAAVPTNTSAPAISGITTEGDTLTADDGTWSDNGGGALSYSYQWQGCIGTSDICTDIAGATASTYAVVAGDVGDTVIAEVTASNEFGASSPAPSAATAVIAAGAERVLSWSAPMAFNARPYLPVWVPAYFTGGVSCASASLCVAADLFGDVFTSTSPTAGNSYWTRADVDGGATMDGVSCPTASLCVAVDGYGNVVTSSAPTGGASAWTVVPISGAGHFRGVSCTAAPLCVAVDDKGNVVTSTRPTGGASAWTVTPVDTSGLTYIEAISCTAAPLCTGVDGGNVVTSINPTGGARAWTFTPILTDGGVFNAVSCTTSGFCAAVGEFGDIAATADPTGGSTAWTVSKTAISELLTAISCTSASFCAAGSTGDGNVEVSTDPGTASPTWATTNIDGSDSMTGISCPSTALCVASDSGDGGGGGGDLVVGAAP